MRVKIISAELDTYWYANKIGNIYEVQGLLSSSDSYILTGDESYKSIAHRDCEITGEEPERELGPIISFHGATTVVRWPDGKINSAKPCQAQPEKKIKADEFDPTIGFLHCIAKKYVPDYKKIIASATPTP